MGTTINSIDPTAAAYIKDIYGKLPAANVADTLVSTNRNRYYYRGGGRPHRPQLGQKFSVFGRYSHDSIPTTEPGGLFTGEPLPGVGTTQSNEPSHILSVHSPQLWSPTLVNDAGYAYSWGAITSNPIGTMAIANSPDIKPTLPFQSNAGTVPFLSFDLVQGLLRLRTLSRLQHESQHFRHIVENDRESLAEVRRRVPLLYARGEFDQQPLVLHRLLSGMRDWFACRVAPRRTAPSNRTGPTSCSAA